MQYDMSSLMQLAQSPAGQQLIAYFQQSGGSSLDTAVTMAAQGNLEQAKQTLSSLLSSPQAQSLLKQLEEQT